MGLGIKLAFLVLLLAGLFQTLLLAEERRPGDQTESCPFPLLPFIDPCVRLCERRDTSGRLIGIVRCDASDAIKKRK